METVNLSKKYKGREALKNVSIALERGKIYGLVGINGSGKTTLMSIITGLVKSDSGKVMILNEDRLHNIIKKRKYVGSLIESTSFYPEMNAYENVNMERISKGIPNKELVDEVLKAVNLKDAGTKRVKHFSKGMKQRLGIAKAMLGDPEIIILDEPNNDLDPISILEIRNLLLSLNQEKNITILISGQDLEDVEQLVTDFIIIHNGQIIEKISREDLHEKCQRYISIRTQSLSITSAIFEKYLHTTNFKVMPDDSIKLYDYVDEVNQVIICLVEHQIEIDSICIQEESLETYFVHTIKEALNDQFIKN